MGDVILAFGLGVLVVVYALLIGHLVSEGVADELKKVKK
jgi:hypothetical protein